MVATRSRPSGHRSNALGMRSRRSGRSAALSASPAASMTAGTAIARASAVRSPDRRLTRSLWMVPITASRSALASRRNAMLSPTNWMGVLVSWATPGHQGAQHGHVPRRLELELSALALGDVLGDDHRPHDLPIAVHR